MDAVSGIMGGFEVALQPGNLLAALLGVFVGTIIGVLPGIGPVTGVALLIPLTFGQEPVTAIIMMAGIYYGAMYGGALTSILLNAPGESASVVTTFDGYQMAQQGRGGVALGIAAIASFVAGTLGVVFLTFLAPTMARFALTFGSVENFALMALGLSTIAGLGSGSTLKALISAVIGLMVATVGLDSISGATRYSFGFPELLDGINFTIAAIGIFALGEVFTNVERSWRQTTARIDYGGFRSLWPRFSDLRQTFFPMIRGSFIGFITGVLPGAGATVSSFLSYMVERRLSKTPERFGKGAPEGLAGPEAANNSATAGAMAPMLMLGIPGSATTAVIFGALLSYGLRPGPTLFTQDPDFIWGLFASMYVGNVMLLVLNLPLIGLFAQVVRLPYAVINFVIIIFSVLGAYGLNNSLFDVYMLFLFGIVGYLLRKAEIPVAPLALGLVLGPLMEQAFRQSLIASRGSYIVFLQNPVSLVLLVAAVLFVVGSVVWDQRLKRQQEQGAAGQT